MAGKLVEEVHKVTIFVFEWKEKVVLKKSRYSRVSYAPKMGTGLYNGS